MKTDNTKEEEIPKCNSCVKPMVEVGKIDDWVTVKRNRGLYQCPECKDVKIY